jgi:hypothetical protein
MDTSVPMHLRPPSTSSSEERMYPEDLKWYEYFDDLGKKITGYSRTGDVYDDYGGGSPLFGHGPDFGYWYFGSVWYGDELWNSGKNKDYNGDGNIDQIEVLMWDDNENEGDGFIEWKPAKHPVYGVIEIGGFNPKFFSQNPPPRHLEPWIRNQAFFNLEMAKHLPGLEWENIEVKKIKSYRTDSADYQVNVRFRNAGMLPTALKQAQLVKIVRDDRVIIEIDSVALVDEKPAYKILNNEDTRRRRDQQLATGGLYLENPAYGKPAIKFVTATGGGSVTTAVFNIRLYNQSELKGKATVLSTRGGIIKDKEFIIR